MVEHKLNNSVRVKRGMSTCKCMTLAGHRCSRVAVANGFCKQHLSCKKETHFQEDSARDVAREVASRVASLSRQISSLEDEREFYYEKLMTIETFAESLPTKKRNSLLKLLKK